MFQKPIFDKLKEYHFRFQHVTIIFGILIFLQLIISYINKATIRDFLSSTQEWYQRESAEELANLTTANLELILETINPNEIKTFSSYAKIRQSFNIIFSQQSLQHDIKELCLLVRKDSIVYSIDDGEVLYGYLYKNPGEIESSAKHKTAVSLYKKVWSDIIEREEIKTIVGEDGVYNIFVPLVVKGEYIGTMYVKMQKDFSIISEKVIASYNESSIIYISLILFGLLAMYFISTYTVKERDEVQMQLLRQHSDNLIKEINYQKELLFTKRIYHTHHKAEKVMGFIKDDLRSLTPENIDAVQRRMTKYSNFISRVIYDMKWYDPPVQTIRNPLFQTDINEVIQFLVDCVFLRTSTKAENIVFDLQLEKSLPKIAVNEYVIWEILEPIIQNSIDHAGVDLNIITITTAIDGGAKALLVKIADNGKGLAKELIETNENGIKKLFLESVSTKQMELPNSGYGCYIAYEMCRRCGWLIDAENRPEGGCVFTITINNISES
jgi:hypothetical protein